jgi:molybdopterin converting factor small subunit
VARLRLFGPAREAAGLSVDEVDGASVADILSEAGRRYGPEFGEILGHSKVWLNGEQVGPEASVDAADEVAVIPPVSGG